MRVPYTPKKDGAHYSKKLPTIKKIKFFTIEMQLILITVWQILQAACTRDYNCVYFRCEHDDGFTHHSERIQPT